MPNIVEYVSKSELHPSDKGINAAADAARFYNQVGDQIGRSINRGIQDIADKVEKHQAVMEASELYKTGTELEMNVEKRWLEYSEQNRGNPHAGDAFMAEVAPLLDQWGEGASTDHGKQLAATLKSSIRNKIFNRVAADQAEMDFAHVDDNHTQTKNTLGSGLITDPSELNFRRTLGTMRAANEAMTATISDVSKREQALTHYNRQDYSDLTAARYQGVAESIKNQIAETGGETSPALEQLEKDVKSQLGFEYLSPEQQVLVAKLGEAAVSQGQELFNSRNATAKSQAIEAGNARYAEIHSVATALAMAGQGPTPDLIEAVQDYAKRFGATNSGQVAALDSFILSGQDRAQQNKVQPFSQQARDNIQSGFSLPPGDPRRPTLASLVQAYSRGDITKEDLSGYTEILNKLDQPDKDPAFKAAWDNFVRWRDSTAASIGYQGGAGTQAARSRFVNDVTNNFMARGKAMGDWDRAYDRVTNVNTPGNFANPTILEVYRKAANRPDAGAWLNSRWPQWNPNNNTLTWPSGTGGGKPAAPAAPAPAQTPAADLKRADEIIWGKK